MVDVFFPRDSGDGAVLQTLPDQIAKRIYASIVGGKYVPGERIREKEVSANFGVSRAPVREALRILERDSVVRVIPNRGAHVTPLSVKELNEIFEVRRVLAGVMVRRLGMPAADMLLRLGKKVKKLERLAKNIDGAAYVETSVDLSLLLAQASGNDRLAQIMRSLARQSWRYTQLALGDALRRQESARTGGLFLTRCRKGRTKPLAKPWKNWWKTPGSGLCVCLILAQLSCPRRSHPAECLPNAVPSQKSA
jgi:DNA-binding GntR family transcriptional regulator